MMELVYDPSIRCLYNADICYHRCLHSRWMCIFTGCAFSWWSHLKAMLSSVCTCRGSREVFHADPDNFFLNGMWGREFAHKGLMAGFPKVFRQESIYYGIDAGISIHHAMRDDPECKGCISHREISKLGPHGYDVLRQPRQKKSGHN